MGLHFKREKPMLNPVDFTIHMIKKIINKLNDYGKLVMFSHTIFSLSFAVVALLAASNGKPSLYIVIWASLALLGARTGANALNRIVDAKIDAKNPRTANRQIPKGEISILETILLTGVCFLLLIFSAYKLNPLCMYLSPLALFLMFIYSYTKRFTWLCHVVLGITCACAPVGAWLAVTGQFSWEAIFLGGANCLWTAGFDIIYGSQDYEFDKQNGLHSIPVRFGVKEGLIISTLFHLAALGSLGLYWLICFPNTGIILLFGICLIFILMVIQHKMVTPEHLENVNIASYSISQITSIVFLIFGVADIYF